jgi:AcrR family transcriptional regulator
MILGFAALGGRKPLDAMPVKKTTKPERTYTISLANRKARGSGHERLGEILAAAKELFLEHGAENVTTRKIAERVGISQTALFSYYKTKDEILGRLMQDAFGELAHALANAGDAAADTRDWLQRAVAGYVGFGLKYPDEYRLAFMVVKAHKKTADTSSAQPGIVQRIALPVFQQLERKVAEAMAAGALRGDLGSPMLVAQTLWAAMHGLTALLIARPRPHFPWEDLDDLIRAQTALILAGILAKR